MSAILHRGTWMAAAVTAVVVTAALIPVCAMPDCTTVASVSCGALRHGYSGCGQPVVMKHESGDALTASPVQTDDLVALNTASLPDARTIVQVATLPPVPTASPPPLDPLGVRLLV